MEENTCVYYFFNDKRKREKKLKPLHKLLLKDFYVSNELTNIQKIQSYKNHFYVCENNSELEIKELEEDMVELKSCKNISKDDTVLLKFENREIIYLKNYLKALSSSTKYIFTIIHFYKNLLKSIHLLVENQLVHNNIHFDTIVVDKKHYPLISDFSLSINISSPNIQQCIKHFIIAYDPTYLEWTPEFHILSYLLTNKLDSLSSYNIENIIDTYICNHTILKTFGDTLVSSYKEEAQQYFKKYVNQPYNYVLNDILQYYGTWDNYALSIMFLRILIGIHKSIQIKNKFIILFMKLLVCNIHLNPFKRLSVSSTTNKFDNILDNLEPKDYREILEHLYI